jgi:translation initiation factor IF-1
MARNTDEFRQGIVVEALPNTMFRIKFDGSEEGEEEIAYLSGRMKRFRIRILVGDKVEVKIDEYGGKGRIVKRL